MNTGACYVPCMMQRSCPKVVSANIKEKKRKDLNYWCRGYNIYVAKKFYPTVTW